MENNNNCIEEGCGEPLYSTFWCEGHFLEWKREREPVRTRRDQTYQTFLTKYESRETIDDDSVVGTLDHVSEANYLDEDPSDLKVCADCNSALPVEDFGKMSCQPDGLNKSCMTCARRARRLVAYKLSHADMESLLASQGHKCAICDKRITEVDCHVDHDHSCCRGDRSTCGSCVRGLLCPRCNVFLGRSGDSIDFFRSAVNYLENYSLRKESS